MSRSLALLSILIATPALAQLPPLPQAPVQALPPPSAQYAVPRYAPPPPAYVRPGNEIGTGHSLPFSPNASNITPDDTRSTIAPTLPIPAISEDSPPAAFLRAARDALLGGRTGEAQEALERAESRTLTRSTRPSLANRPAQSPFLLLLGQARGALAQGDSRGAIRFIDRALSDPESRMPAF